MPPSSKENEVLVATPEAPPATSGPGTFRPDETASRPSPVALEVPVSVNGARAVEGSDKREPFSETTKTVLVFGNGAVIRLSSPVSAGQLLFLTNEKTKKEVVCQVVKSKNYRNVSGYVELEFTESVVGFWGMRFPTDRIAAPAPAANSGVTMPSAAKGNPVAPAPALPKGPAAVTSVASRLPEVKQAAPAAVPPSPQAPAAQVKVPAQMASPETTARTTPLATPVAKAPDAPAAPTIAASLASSVASLLGSPEVPPAATSKAPVPQGGDASTEELKQQAARLQEQLSSMLFGATPAAAQPPEASEPAAESKPAVSLTSKVLEKAGPEPLAPPKLSSAGKPVPAPIKSSLDAEEVKIPSWLEPLARNAAAPASTQELIEREKAKHAAELAAGEREEAKLEVLATAAPSVAPVSEPEPELPAATGLPPLLEDEALSQPPAAKSKRGLWAGVAAAAVLAAAGGAWYFLRPTNETASPVAQTARATFPATSAPAPVIRPSAQSAPQNTVAAAQPGSKPAISEPLGNSPAPTPAVNTQPVLSNREARTSANPIPAASTERIARSTPPPAAAPPAKPEPKKPSIGEVHLASPTVSRSEDAAEDGLAAPTISSGTDGGTAGLGSELGASGQPAAPKAPLPVGGDVKPAKLLSSTPPIYPALAKTQHISGEVSIDASIDVNGKVTTMKVISGPTLLRQAAMDAVRQWKYQPASLDGNPVSMHLTVTVQFRIQ